MKSLLKLIGVALFAWIIWSIDLHMLWDTLQGTDKEILALSFPCMLLLYICRTMRWHTIVKTTGIQAPLRESWIVWNIGTFLGTITPAKLGEFGRAAYLQQTGITLKRALFLSFADRVADIVAVLLFGGIGGMILLDSLFAVMTSLCGTVVLIALLLLLRKKGYESPMTLSDISSICLWTVLGWISYFLWAVVLAYSLGVILNPLLLTLVFTVTGLISMLPIAPSGLGTRDIALVTLLGQYGIAAEHAVALALLMFSISVLMSGIGGWYWLHRKGETHTLPA